MASLEQQSKGGNKADVRYLTPLDIETRQKQNTVVLQKTVLSILIIKTQIF